MMNQINEKAERNLFDPDFCENRCPICTRARKGIRWARFLQAIEMVRDAGRVPLGAGKAEEVWGKTQRAAAVTVHRRSRPERNLGKIGR